MPEEAPREPIAQPPLRQIALAFPLSVPHYALIMEGIVAYAKQRSDWTFTMCPASFSGFPETFTMTLKSLRGWPGDGVIGVITQPDECKTARQLNLPVVNLSGTLQNTGLPRVMVDNYSIGRLAAEHLLSRGLRRFAFYGIERVWYARCRRDGFLDTLRRAGCTDCQLFEAPPRIDPSSPWIDSLNELEQWLGQLQPPTGVFAVHDYRARLLIDQCQRMGLNVPSEIAVVGADNDVVICEFSRPSLSSVLRNGRMVGFETARLLDRLMQGESPPDDDILIPPDGVAERGSTDMLAIEEPLILDAVDYINRHLGRPFGVGQLLQRGNVSRRYFEKLFKREMNCSPHEYLCRKRVEHAQKLLTDVERLPIGRIARECGFTGTRNFRNVFRRLTGLSPRDYRQQHEGE